MRILLSILFFVLVTMPAHGQDKSINDKLINVSMEDAYSKQPSARKLLVFKKRSARYNPLTYISAGLLYLYQNLISEQIQAECTYEISCSEYTKLSIQESGIFIGMLKGFNQLSACFNGARYEHPSLYINSSNNKIINCESYEVE